MSARSRSVLHTVVISGCSVISCCTQCKIKSLASGWTPGGLFEVWQSHRTESRRASLSTTILATFAAQHKQPPSPPSYRCDPGSLPWLRSSGTTIQLQNSNARSGDAPEHKALVLNVRATFFRPAVSTFLAPHPLPAPVRTPTPSDPEACCHTAARPRVRQGAGARGRPARRRSQLVPTHPWTPRRRCAALPVVMATATGQNPNQTKVPGVSGSGPAAGGNSTPEISKFAPELQQALAGNYKQACSTASRPPSLRTCSPKMCMS